MNIYFRDQSGKLRQYFSPLFDSDGPKEIDAMRNCVKEAAIKEGFFPKSAVLALIRVGE